MSRIRTDTANCVLNVREFPVSEFGVGANRFLLLAWAVDT